MSEDMLQTYLINAATAQGAQLMARNWHVVSGWTHCGVGDVVLKLADGSFLVVEVKYLDLWSSGRTAITKRRKHRNKVHEQAYKYGQAWRLRHPGVTTHTAVYTNERGLELLTL
jgi:Holliday junction resolvase-like predicted endonuclease